MIFNLRRFQFSVETSRICTEGDRRFIEPARKAYYSLLLKHLIWAKVQCRHPERLHLRLTNGGHPPEGVQQRCFASKVLWMINICTPRIILRQPISRDIDALYRIYGDPRTNAFNPTGPMRSLADAEATMARWLGHWQENGFGMWAIALVERPHAVVGFGGLTYRSFGGETKVNLGYRLAVEVWGQGFATELATTAIGVGFQRLDLQEIYALVRSSHTASRKVLEKAGLRQFGVLDDVPGDVPSIVYRIAKGLHFEHPSYCEGAK